MAAGSTTDDHRDETNGTTARKRQSLAKAQRCRGARRRPGWAKTVAGDKRDKTLSCSVPVSGPRRSSQPAVSLQRPGDRHRRWAPNRERRPAANGGVGDVRFRKRRCLGLRGFRAGYSEVNHPGQRLVDEELSSPTRKPARCSAPGRPVVSCRQHGITGGTDRQDRRPSSRGRPGWGTADQRPSARRSFRCSPVRSGCSGTRCC
jgi:hypothetical protein